MCLHSASGVEQVAQDLDVGNHDLADGRIILLLFGIILPCAWVQISRAGSFQANDERKNERC